MRKSRIFLVFAFLAVAFVSYAAGRASVDTPPPPGVSIEGAEEVQIDGIEDLGDLDDLEEITVEETDSSSVDVGNGVEAKDVESNDVK